MGCFAFFLRNIGLVYGIIVLVIVMCNLKVVHLQLLFNCIHFRILSTGVLHILSNDSGLRIDEMTLVDKAHLVVGTAHGLEDSRV